jgi:hypothetical protein
MSLLDNCGGFHLRFLCNMLKEVVGHEVLFLLPGTTAESRSGLTRGEMDTLGS